jgi:Protein of unknown function (DUF1569)
MKNIFNPTDAQSIISRIQQLRPDTQPRWGTMSVDQMLAHCNVTYDMAYTDKYPKPGAFKKMLLRFFVKNGVVNEKPYPHNIRTAPPFIIEGDKDFDSEKNRLIAHIQKTQQLGSAYFEGLESHSFGPLTAKEWNNLFAKHLEHHLEQFGV